jgi:pentose-5-phosphate-3-epimerase
MIVEKNFLKEIDFFIYKKKHLIIYIFIGILSLLIELGVRRLLIEIYNEESFLLHFSIFFGIIFAFYFNIKFNFNVPKLYLKRSLIYFFIICCSSYIFQYYIKSKIYFGNFNFEQTRFLVSGIFFLIGYFFHIKFSFIDSRKVGVAIYANGYEDIKKIYEKIGLYPDFIHVDIIDKTMNKNASDTKLSKVEVVKAYWPNHQIHTHIMSTNPLSCLDKSIYKFSDIIYFHNEFLDNKAEVINEIKKHGKIPGLVLHSVNDYEDLENTVKDFNEVLVLSIEKCGVSGQNFNKKSFDLINKLNKLNQRKKFKVCVDGGVKSNLISKFTSERIVSGSDVLNNQNPKRQIMRLQTLSRYEK